VVGALALAQLMLVVDVTVANVALPDIATSLDLTRGAASWVITAYALMLGGFMLLGGRVADLYGARRVMLAGLTVFVGASVAAALSWDAGSLLTARAVQGLGAAFLSPAALAAVTTTFSGADRHKALGVWGAVGAVGASIGVLLGGLLTAGPGWRWIFLVNAPIGLVVLAVVLAAVPATAARRSEPLDVTGAVLVTAASGLGVFGLTRVADAGSLSVASAGLLLGSLALYAAFVVVERRVASPLVPPALLADRRVLTGSLVMLASSALLVGLFFLMSFTLQGELGWSALRTGVAFLPMAVGALVGAHAASRAVIAVGPRVVGPSALGLTAAALALAAVGADTVPVLLAGVGVASVGLGAGFVTATTTALGRRDHATAGVASGLVNTFHELGGGLGVAALSGAVAAGGVAGQAGPGFRTGLWAMAAVAAALGLVGVWVIPRGRVAPGAVRFGH
jgi:MFS family permease